MEGLLAMLQRVAGQDGQQASQELAVSLPKDKTVVMRMMEGLHVGMAELTKAGTQREEQTPMFALA
jgi:hypothetical protein